MGEPYVRLKRKAGAGWRFEEDSSTDPGLPLEAVEAFALASDRTESEASGVAAVHTARPKDSNRQTAVFVGQVDAARVVLMIPMAFARRTGSADDHWVDHNVAPIATEAAGSPTEFAGTMEHTHY